MAKQEIDGLGRGLTAAVAVESATNGAAAAHRHRRRRRSSTSRRPSAPPAARRPAPRSRAPRTPTGSRRPSRPDPVAILEAQAVSREQALVPIRYGRMLVSPFTFYRGAAALMAADLSDGTRTRPPHPAVRRRPPHELRHVRGAGPAAGVRHQRLRRDAARVRSSGTSSGWSRASRSPGRDRGFNPKVRAAINLEVVKGYRRGDGRASRPCATSTSGTPASTSSALIKEFAVTLARPRPLERMEKNVEKARTKDSLKAFSKLTHLVDGEPRIISDPPLIVPIDELARRGRCVRDAGGHPAADPLVPALAAERPAHASSSGSGTSTWPARSSASAASARAPGSC